MSEFIEVSKDGEKNIFIHPGALKDHLSLGWKVVEAEVEVIEEEAPPAGKPETAKERRAREKAERESVGD